MIALLPALAGVALAGEPRFSVGIGYDYATGKYGTNVTTTTQRIPLVIGFYPSDRLAFSLEIPYVSQHSSITLRRRGQNIPPRDNVVIVGGRPGTGGGSRTITLGESRRGLGDISLSADYVLLEESDVAPLLRPSLYIKFPTTDEASGLGTGEFDFGAGIGAAKWLGNWSVAVDAMLVVPGSSAQYQADNYWTYAASVDYPVTDRLFAGPALYGSQALSGGGSNSLEARVNVSYWPSRTVGLSAYLSTGLTDTSAAIGSGIFASYHF